MGKSTFCGMLQSLGVPVHDSDACVHDLFKLGSESALAVAAAFPYYRYPQIYDRKTKGIKRKELGKVVFADDQKRQELEDILHPYVRASQDEFLKLELRTRQKIVALDIPLLFETGAEERVDYTVVVSAPFFIQKQRVMARPGMSEEKFQAIFQRQMPDHEKRALADFVVPSGLGRGVMMREAKRIVYTLLSPQEEPEQNKDDDLIDA